MRVMVRVTMTMIASIINSMIAIMIIWCMRMKSDGKGDRTKMRMIIMVIMNMIVSMMMSVIMSVIAIMLMSRTIVSVVLRTILSMSH